MNFCEFFYAINWKLFALPRQLQHSGVAQSCAALRWASLMSRPHKGSDAPRAKSIFAAKAGQWAAGEKTLSKQFINSLAGLAGWKLYESISVSGISLTRIIPANWFLRNVFARLRQWRGRFPWGLKSIVSVRGDIAPPTCLWSPLNHIEALAAFFVFVLLVQTPTESSAGRKLLV